MSQMLPDGAEVMRRAVCGDVCPSPPAPPPADSLDSHRSSEEKELLRRRLASPESARPRARQKSRWKLKFHHQALPQEYLDHYEQSLQKTSAKQRKKPEERKEREPAAPTDETFKIWAQRLAGAPQEAANRNQDKRRRQPAAAPARVQSFRDLPYMGEMTLNNCKPRRGRKPKKADICHLIYENYGTVVPGQPTPAPVPAPAPPAPRSQLQHRLISSLLERRLAHEARRRPPPAPPSPGPAPAPPGPLHSDHEPLNLCIRDLRDLKLQIQRKFGNIYGPPEEAEQPNAISVIRRAPASPAASPPADQLAGYVYLPHAGVYMHPLALQAQLLYQRLAAGHVTDHVTDHAAPPTASPSSPPEDSKSKLVLKQISELLDPKLARGAGAGAGEAAGGADSRRASPPAAAAQAPIKRKRSAIFIPPAPTRSNPSNPTAEVSICKFKFTGGSKPSLQEKKMLSVDAGGNFRYYSGTGGRAGKGPDPRGPPPRPAPPAPPAADDDDSAKKKRKSRKSLQREKLEQTFKEKGFLIQTQQLQSAEGATYCKFRQLRKFTRYLFRSWKDYLPGELEDKPADAAAADHTPGLAPSTAGEWG